jgi:type II secretory pathway component GspD/PulD (secretin)
VDIKDGRISVSAKEVPLEILCKAIENKSGIRFRIQDALLEDKLSVEIKDLPLLKCLKRLLAHVNYMFCFDNRNRLSEVLIVGRSEPYAPPVLRKPPLRRDIPRVRRSFNRPRL